MTQKKHATVERRRACSFWFTILCWSMCGSLIALPESQADDLDAFTWNVVTPSSAWTRRAGLQVVDLEGCFYLTGGRTPLDSSFLPFPLPLNYIWGDVWKSKDRGLTWEKIPKVAASERWSPRAFHQMVTKNGALYVLGGQNFKLFTGSDFFNDVWRSRDGKTWQQVTPAAGWSGRAGHCAVVFKQDIYVFAGSINDDEAVVGGPPTRIYYNDVWKSSNDGKTWVRLLEHAPWAERAGARAAVKDGFLYLFGGEAGFTCSPVPCTPPYFNDVWRTANGIEWEQVTAAADWQPRPGHKVVVVDDQFVLFGGFGQSQDPSDPFQPSNPVDVWVSPDGAQWRKLTTGPWNATSPEQIKFDFDALSVTDAQGTVVYTFGGDRETFDLADPTNYLKVDNDVWKYSLPALTPARTIPPGKPAIPRSR